MTSSPFLLTSIIKKHIQTYNNEDPKFVEPFLKLLHTDKLNSGNENIHNSYNFYNEAKSRLGQALSNFQKLQSNSPDLKYLGDRADMGKTKR